MEDEAICRFGVLKYVLPDNNSEWFVEFDQLCKNYGIGHHHTSPQWPRCNGMVERVVKTFKHGLIVLSTNPEHVEDYDKHLLKILFGYRCGEKATTKKFPTYAIEYPDSLVES